MPATSKQQQKLMGIVRALQTGAMKPSDASKKAQQMAKSMKKSDVKDFAATKHKGLPKKAKKEEGAIPTMYMVRKPMEGLTAEKMVCEINPLEGIQPLNIDMSDVHSVHASAEDAQQIASEAYQKYCDEAIALEEKKDTTSGKIKKAIDQLEKKRKEHLTLAKDDPKSASKHKEHIAKIATQIDDLMTKLERIEKSKKAIEKKEDKKELKEDLAKGKIRVFKTNAMKAYDSEDVDSTDILNRSKDIKVKDTTGFYLVNKVELKNGKKGYVWSKNQKFD